MKKIPHTLLQTLPRRKRVQNFSQKILTSMVVEARQSFQFFWQKSGFLKIIEVYLNLGIGFCITWLILPNYKKTNFKLTTWATLNTLNI